MLQQGAAAYGDTWVYSPHHKRRMWRAIAACSPKSPNAAPAGDALIHAGLAHLWLVTLHPFGDGNGRISRAVGDMALARAEGTAQKFYSLSAQLQRERKQYCDQLETTQRGTLDVTPWLSWFLACLPRAVQGADGLLAGVLDKAQFWQRWAGTPMNPRQTLVLNHVLDGMEGKLTNAKWAALGKCSADTAARYQCARRAAQAGGWGAEYGVCFGQIDQMGRAFKRQWVEMTHARAKPSTAWVPKKEWYRPRTAHTKTLALMRERSPHSLRRFLLRTETLLWLEQAQGQLKTPVGKGKEVKTVRPKR